MEHTILNEEVDQPVPMNEGSHFTQEQVHQIMKIIQEVKSDSAQLKVNNFVGESFDDNARKGKKNEHSWILDTGATNHVTFSKNNFISFRQIDPIRIKLPNG